MAKNTLQSIIDDAIEEFNDFLKENPEVREPHDQIFEIADSSVPVYTHDLMQLAAENNDLATTEPDIGPAFDGKPTPVNIIAANVFEAIEQALWDRWREWEKEDHEENV